METGSFVDSDLRTSENQLSSIRRHWKALADLVGASPEA